MITITHLLSDLLTTLESALQPPGPLMPALSISATVTAEAATALTRANADAQAPARVTNLRTSYESDFGFTEGLRRGIDKTIWEPWRGLIQADLEAVLAVAGVVGMPPAHVLALWLQEGKRAHDPTLHGQPHPIPNLAFAATVTAGQLRSWLRSVILYQAFGSDALTSITPVEGEDNRVNGADHNHDAPFVAGLRRLRSANVPGSDQFSDAAALKFFSTTQGALRDLVLTNLAGVPVVAALPAGETINGSVRLRSTSISSWLYLQTALFAVFRKDMEARFIAEYGPPIDLSETPWVTYLGWNGGIAKQYPARFSNRPPGETPEERMAQLFNAPPATPLNANELALYNAEPISRSALGNAIQLKYLTEVVEPWFAKSP